MRILYLDVTGGASGDMLLGALLDAGAGEGAVRGALEALDVPGWSLDLEEVSRAGLRALHANVTVTGEHELRHLADVRGVIEAAGLDAPVAERALAVFKLIADAEAHVHGTDPSKVHFHEIGAVDTIVDVVGTAAALADLGVERVFASEVATGTGYVDIAHGRLPVPVPATLELLRGVPVLPRTAKGELTTPTGAALLRGMVDAFGQCPAMRIGSVGVGAGSRDDAGRPNVVRAVVGEGVSDTDATSDAVTVLECAVDDMTGEEIGALTRSLLARGALDVFTTAVAMKKSRPGVLITVLCLPGDGDDVQRRLFLESTTLGVRRTTTLRTTLPRRFVEVETDFGKVRVKVARLPDGRERASAEFDDCERLAREAGVGVRDVMRAAEHAFDSAREGERGS